MRDKSNEPSLHAYSLNTNKGDIRITNVGLQFEREPLLSPFGFKGGYLSELWQVISFLESDSGQHAIGLGTQSVLWSDGTVFATSSEAGGNAYMLTLTEHALRLLKNSSFNSPMDLIDPLYEEILEYGKTITSNPALRKTFALNALVSVDNALWLLYAKERGITDFDDLIPAEYKSTFSTKHEKLAAMPLISYNVTPEELRREVGMGYFFMKVKIGQPGTQEEMLEKDKKRLTEIHDVLKEIPTPYTKNGKLPYYFDANGRYETKDSFYRFLEHADKIGALEQIVMIEEPFSEDLGIDVSDIPVRLAVDESAHTDKDTIERLSMGYKAVALKPIAKTLSMSMKIAKAATERDIPCFCADLTVNPVLVEWNKNVAARLPAFPSLENLGLIESNGHQNYVNWEQMQQRFPKYEAPWIEVKGGFYHLNENYYNNGGGIFDPIPHYETMFIK
ncbi:MAG: L-alanine-DL-glutamate epimerase [Bacteroidota bacterium]|nr:L-alanine-DL-glutamate epimerase [Bacteroidota bacterium]